MKWIIVLSSVLTTVEIFMSTATEILYVLPDNSTDVVSCPSPPCATLSQYLLENGRLPVVSNVEYHFLPGEHHVPANMILQDLHNFTMIGTLSSSSPAVLVGCSQAHVIDIINSCFVMITNVVIKHCSILPNGRTELRNVKLSCCFSCKLQNVTLLQYGLIALSLIGESYLHNIKLEITQFPQFCCQSIVIQYILYSTCPSWNSYINHMHNVTINQLFIQNYIKCNTYAYANVGLHMNLDYTVYNVKILLINSLFYNMDRTALQIENRCTIKRIIILITNCTFELINANAAIQIVASPVNQSISFTNSKFHRNEKNLIRIDVSLPPNNRFACRLVNYIHQELLLTAINISFIKCQFRSNRQKLLTIESKVVASHRVNVLLKSLNILHNSYSQLKRIQHNDIISVTKANIHISGPVNVAKNNALLSIMKFQSCDILFSGKITFDTNYSNEVISLDTHIKVMEYTNITFVGNKYFSKLITIESTEDYYQPHPFCLFQYITLINSSVTKELLPHYIIILNHNYNGGSTGITLPSQNNDCSVSYCHFTSHCKWVPSAAFYNYSSETINKQIIQNDDQNCYHRNHICYCSKSNEINCSIDTLGSVYPGQILQTSLCNMCNNDNITVLYAEVHNVNLPSSTCKITHHSQLINFIGNHSHTVNYTIVSSTPNSNRCELFLTASPFLNKIYDTFYVELLPCPIGFILQD